MDKSIIDKTINLAGWSASVSNETQPKPPVLLGLAVGIGALLWLAPFMGLNSVLNPAKLSRIIGGGSEVNNFLALLGTLGAVTSTITTIIIGALSDLTRSRWGRRTPWILSGSVLTAPVMVGLGMIETKEQLWILSSSGAYYRPLLTLSSHR